MSLPRRAPEAPPAEGEDRAVLAPARMALLRPQVLLGALAVVAGVAFLVAGGGPRVGAPPRVDIAPVAAATGQPTEVRLVLVDADGLERPRFVQVSLPEARDARLAAVVSALRDAMRQEGSWPAALGAPEVFVEDVNRRRVAVLDLRLDAPVAVSVSQELQLLRSIRETVLANDIDAVRFLRDGRPADTLLGHVAVASGL